jgi:regulator of replication initiation timing
MFDDPPHTLLTQSTTLQSEIEALKRENSEEQARLTVALQENKKLRHKIQSLRGKLNRSGNTFAYPKKGIQPQPTAGASSHPTC